MYLTEWTHWDGCSFKVSDCFGVGLCWPGQADAGVGCCLLLVATTEESVHIVQGKALEEFNKQRFIPDVFKATVEDVCEIKDGFFFFN